MSTTAPSNRTLAALLIGDFTSPEFLRVAEQLARIARVETAKDCQQALARLAVTDTVPDVIVVAQLWPGQHPNSELDRLQQTVPLTRILAVAGTWCEGESRSGRPWPGMLRTYWHGWLPRWQNEFDRLSISLLPAWGLPTTATDDERTLLPYRPAPTSGGLIAVHSRSHDLADMLCDACRQHGYSAVWLDPRRSPRIAGPSAVLWEGTPQRVGELEIIRAMFPTASLLALVDFPRWEDIVQAEAAGAGIVLAKPIVVDDLFRHLDGVLKQSRQGNSDGGNCDGGDSDNMRTRGVA